jgi:predicted GTPase
MSVESLLATRTELADIISRNSNLVGKESASLSQQHGVDSVDKLKKAFDVLEDDERLMQIGIVGRVKAGKSSLLNALFFNGKTILPKAATPMTAALTTITWGERVAAEVEFYSDVDIESLKSQAKEYTEIFDKAKIAAIDEMKGSLVDKFKRKLLDTKGVSDDKDRYRSDESKIEERANRKARTVAQGYRELAAAYDQCERLENSALSLSSFGSKKEIQADNVDSLKSILEDYVGSSGQYMPYTKSVHLKLPNDSLKDICVIDTPGLNDPILSREQRTNELLMHCDVVFIVSPAGQFLSNEDRSLMGRIVDKEGVHELYLVASQVDNNLYGSEVKKPDVRDALAHIKRKLADQAKNVLSDYKKSEPSVGRAFDNLISEPAKRIIEVSGMCHGLGAKFENKQDWDDGEKKVWENLKTNYPLQFSNDEDKAAVSKSNLDLLANNEVLKRALATARAQKDEILSKKKSVLLAAKTESVKKYQSELLRYIQERENSINNCDVEQLRQQSDQLAAKRERLTYQMGGSFDELKAKLDHNLTGKLRSCSERHLSEVKKEQDKASSTEEYTYTQENDGAGAWLARKLWGGGSSTCSGTRSLANTTHIYSAITKLTNHIQSDLERIARDEIRSWRGELCSRMTTEYTSVIGDEGSDPNMIDRILRGIAFSIPVEAFPVDTVIPKELAPRGNKKGDDAEVYLERASVYLGKLEDKIRKQVEGYVAKVRASLSDNIGTKFCGDVDLRISELANDIANKHETLDRLQSLRIELEGVNAA